MFGNSWSEFLPVPSRYYTAQQQWLGVWECGRDCYVWRHAGMCVCVKRDACESWSGGPEGMPLEVCPDNRREELARRRRMPEHYQPTMQNTRRKRKLGPARSQKNARYATRTIRRELTRPECSRCVWQASIPRLRMSKIGIFNSMALLSGLLCFS